MLHTVKVRARRVGEVPIPEPAYQTDGAAGMDLCAAIAEPVTLPPRGRLLVPTGFAMEIPRGYEGQLRARSGLALRHGIGLVNGVGTVDSDYRGEIGVPLINHGDEPFTLTPGARIAQLVICPVARASLDLVTELDTTARSTKGFGSTGSA